MTNKHSEIGPRSSQHNKGIAIIGMACIFPGAPSLDAFWDNIANAHDAVREPNGDEWDAHFYKSKPATLFGKIYCPRGGFITEYAEFDPLEFGIMPTSLNGSDPDQFLALKVAAEALRDAGYNHKTFQAQRGEVVIGRTMAPGVGSLNLIQHGQTVDQVIDVLKVIAPQLNSDDLQEIERRLHDSLNPCNANTIPAVMPNVLSGRIAAKLGFGGRNFVLDAACASSLVAVEAVVQSLESGQADIAIAGGVHINSSPYFYQMFCELGALSTSGTIRPFDENADGTILGEGAGMIVLKRLEDALKDGNRVYAVIRSVASSSDGRSGSSLAPNVDGEALAIQRAYEKSGIAPKTVQLLEAHGTGTRAGDLAEMNAVQKVFFAGSSEEGSESTQPWCAVGTIKSMIGHTQAASGIAGLIKSALALHHKVLPPTLHVRTPSSQIDWAKSPCYINSTRKDWADPADGEPRRAAVSAFGFGGVNAHAVLEECKYSSSVKQQQAEQLPPQSRLSRKSVRLSLRYPALNAKNLHDFRIAATGNQPVNVNATNQSVTDSEALVMQGFFKSMGAFQQQMLGVQEKVMREYFDD